eukprot:COSAG01_NODE_683_length_14253_cov_33.540837_16_plen_118_part_00
MTASTVRYYQYRIGVASSDEAGACIGGKTARNSPASTRAITSSCRATRSGRTSRLSSSARPITPTTASECSYTGHYPAGIPGRIIEAEIPGSRSSRLDRQAGEADHVTTSIYHGPSV